MLFHMIGVPNARQKHHVSGNRFNRGEKYYHHRILPDLQTGRVSRGAFKSQNMALNSYITLDGREMGRAQVVQAEAAGLEPAVDMNPVLLKPTSDCVAQVIVRGEVYKNMSAEEYDRFKPELMNLIMESYNKLAAGNDIIVMEGAGSPAEINLRQRDIVNMGMAEMVDAPVILLGDIDKGGVFASLYGTIMLLDERERKRIKGIIINKFRGDYDLLKPGLAMIEDLVHIPVLGVVPYFNLCIDDEDSVTERFEKFSTSNKDLMNIGIVSFPYMSNFTDFAPLENQPGVQLRYFNKPDRSYHPDLVILPGSKNTIHDLRYIREMGLDVWLESFYRAGGLIMGICGGFQMLGEKIFDPQLVESNMQEIDGLGFLHLHTQFLKEKITSRVNAAVFDISNTILENLNNTPIEGYEIHMGVSTPSGDVKPFTKIISRMGTENAGEIDGYMSADGRVFGTYIHGIFDTPEFLEKLLEIIRDRKGLKGSSSETINYKRFKEDEYDKLAHIIRSNIDINKIHDIIFKT